MVRIGERRREGGGERGGEGVGGKRGRNRGRWIDFNILPNFLHS